MILIEQIESLELSESVRRLVRAARSLAEQYDAPLTTSILLIAAVKTSREDTSSVGILGRALAEGPSPEEVEKRINEWMLWYRAKEPADAAATPTVFDAFQRALVFAQQATGLSVAHGRHLIAALLTIPEGDAGVVDVLRWMGHTPSSLRQIVFDDIAALVRRNAVPDKLTVWRKFLLGEQQLPGPAHLKPSFDNDDTKGVDLLGIERDVRSCATLICAESSNPPLSIGLFGNWGAGKSFFMEQLQKEIAKLAAEAAAAGFDTAYHTRIAQIRFNAWHYVEGNLWASLVEHIFRNLRLSEDEKADVVNERRTHYLAQLDDAIAKESAAHAAIAAATKQTETLATVIATESEAAKSASMSLVETAKLTARDLIQLSDEEKETVQKAVKELGLDRAAAAANEAADSVAQLRESGTETWQIVRWVFRGPGAAWRLFLLAAALFGATIVTAVVVRLAQTGWNTTAIVSFLTAFAAVWTKIYAQAKPVIATMQRARKVADEAVRKAEEERQQKLATLREQEKNALAAADTARAALREAQEKRREAEAALAHLGEDRKLARFIDDRIASDDYRKYLGIPALVRSDFESLSRLMSDNAVMAAEDPHRIDRIVLYIDDLDRCPPRYVRDVLQAVHLLLTFKLFVVVVAVDARWVSRSLEREYRDQLRPEKGSRGANAVAGYGATAYDYLEKIFQVPFWVEPLTEEATRKLLTGLVKVRTPKTDEPKDELNERRASFLSQLDASIQAETAAQTATEARPKLEAFLADRVATAQPPASGDHRLKPADLELEPAELTAMHHLAPLIGRSPRAVKRFANIYRIIRASKTTAELAAFIGEGNARGDYENVLLVLGIVTGAPAISTEMLVELAKADDEETLVTFAERVKPSPPSRDSTAVAEWIRSCDAIATFGTRFQTAVTGDLQPHLRQLSRYSFREPLPV